MRKKLSKSKTLISDTVRKIDEITPAEFKFVRTFNGFSLRGLAQVIDGLTYQAILSWENYQETIKGYQARILRDVVGDKAFYDALDAWEKWGKKQSES